MSTTYVWITTTFKAIHAWPECPINEVSFLRHKHRHLFKVKVTCKVLHNDRDVEFFVLQNAVDKFIEDNWQKEDLGSMSCENLAETLLTHLRCRENRNVVCVEVSEDGENGACVCWE